MKYHLVTKSTQDGRNFYVKICGGGDKTGCDEVTFEKSGNGYFLYTGEKHYLKLCANERITTAEDRPEW